MPSVVGILDGLGRLERVGPNRWHTCHVLSIHNPISTAWNGMNMGMLVIRNPNPDRKTSSHQSNLLQSLPHPAVYPRLIKGLPQHPAHPPPTERETPSHPTYSSHLLPFHTRLHNGIASFCSRPLNSSSLNLCLDSQNIFCM